MRQLRQLWTLFYLDCDELFECGNHEFETMVEMIAEEERVELYKIDLVSVWQAFDKVCGNSRSWAWKNYLVFPSLSHGTLDDYLAILIFTSKFSNLTS